MRIITTQKKQEEPPEIKDDSALKIAVALSAQSEANLKAIEITDEIEKKLARQGSDYMQALKDLAESVKPRPKTIKVTAERMNANGVLIGKTNYIIRIT